MPAKLDKCVADVKAKGKVDNPWAVCNASLGNETKEQINAIAICLIYMVANINIIKTQRLITV